MNDRSYPLRPILAVSAAVFRDGEVLLVRRARPPALGLFTLPGGGVEAGETLAEAIIREVKEETGLAIAPVAVAGHREVIERDREGRIARHFVILAFAARWRAGEPRLNAELDDYRWLAPDAVASLATTEGLAEIVAAARARLRLGGDAA
jgi:8-oxo-dGTP diphosphatase